MPGAVPVPVTVELRFARTGRHGAVRARRSRTCSTTRPWKGSSPPGTTSPTGLSRRPTSAPPTRCSPRRSNRRPTASSSSTARAASRAGTPASPRCGAFRPRCSKHATTATRSPTCSSSSASRRAFVAKVQELYEEPDAHSHDLLEFMDGRVFERDSLPQRIDGEVVGRVWSFRDVTEHQRLESELAHQAFHDSLTGLANQALFRDRVEHAATRLQRSGGQPRGAVHRPRRLQDGERQPRPLGR